MISRISLTGMRKRRINPSVWIVIKICFFSLKTLIMSEADTCLSLLKWLWSCNIAKTGSSLSILLITTKLKMTRPKINAKERQSPTVKIVWITGIFFFWFIVKDFSQLVKDTCSLLRFFSLTEGSQILKIWKSTNSSDNIFSYHKFLCLFFRNISNRHENQNRRFFSNLIYSESSNKQSR